MNTCCLEANSFAFEAELTAELLRRGARIGEVPVRYTPRAFSEGKKIRGHDALAGAWMLIARRCRSKSVVLG